MNQILENRLDFLESNIRNTLLSKDGVNLSIWCPFCQHPNKKKLKLVIHLEKSFYHCWVCDKKGSNVPYLLSKIDKNLSEKSKNIFKNNKKSSSIEIDIRSLFGDNTLDIDLDIEEKVEIPNGFKLLANAFNSNNPDVRDVFKYALKRGINKHKIWFLRLGYSLDSDFSRCLIIPSLDKDGNINYYTARKIDVDTNCGYKYKNANVPKKNIIFNEINIDWNSPLTLVEGPLDLLKTNDNATCLLGSSLTEDMKLFQEIVKNKTTVNLALDADAYYKCVKIAKLLSYYDIKVNILDTRGNFDVGDMTSQYFNKILDEAKEFNNEDVLLNKIKQL
tara:strand:- start:3372 stop:4370 length:999 start_codon:yes stop_codon:yes gene_type:complete